MGELVALPQLLAELGVLLDQLAALGVDEALDAERLGDHARRDAKGTHRAVAVAPRDVALLDGQGAGRASVQGDGDADEGDLLAPLGALGRAVQEARLAAHPGHHRGRAGLGHHPGHPFADPVAHPAGGPGIAQRGLDHEHPARFLQQRDRSAHRATPALQHLQHAVEAGLEIEGAGERLAHLDQHRELARVLPTLRLGPGFGGRRGVPGRGIGRLGGARHRAGGTAC